MLDKHLQISLSILLALLVTGMAALPAVASEPHADDWASPRSIVHALHETISAGPEEQRDWDRYRDLFLDGAMVSMAIKSPRAPGIMAATTEELIEQTEASYGSTGFHEIPLIVEVAEFGAMALVTNSFEVKLRLEDPEPLMRGLNHFQLLNDGERWWIVSNVSTVEAGNWKLPDAFDPNQTSEGTR